MSNTKPFAFENSDLLNKANDADPTGGFSNDVLLAISTFGFLTIFTVLLYLYFTVSSTKSIGGGNDGANGPQEGELTYEEQLEHANTATLNRGQRRARAKYLMKKNRRLQPTQQQQQQHQQHGEGGEQENIHPLGNNQNNNNNEDMALIPAAGEDGEEILPAHLRTQQPTGPSRKERQKIAKEKERQERRLHEEERRLKKQQDEREQKEQKKIKQKMKMEEKERERARLLEQRQNEFKYMFPSPTDTTDITSKSYDNNHDDISNNNTEKMIDPTMTVEDFIQHWKSVKHLYMTETAEQFQVSKQDLLQRIKNLKQQGRFSPNTALYDDASEIYVLIVPEEMNQIAEYIKSKGYLSKQDIMAKMSEILS